MQTRRPSFRPPHRKAAPSLLFRRHRHVPGAGRRPWSPPAPARPRSARAMAATAAMMAVASRDAPPPACATARAAPGATLRRRRPPSDPRPVCATPLLLPRPPWLLRLCAEGVAALPPRGAPRRPPGASHLPPFGRGVRGALRASPLRWLRLRASLAAAPPKHGAWLREVQKRPACPGAAPRTCRRKTAPIRAASLESRHCRGPTPPGLGGASAGRATHRQGSTASRASRQKRARACPATPR
mmetsp:Transcript_65272/g.146711  ORF Transcript_65272/g.146711 Transcript_65272/m.146711 type:complete len:242 (+) Transcript_65272:1782-2507(+)